MNTFVDYLNSTNNMGGDSTGSLAEKQVASEYFDQVKVDRTLGNYITESVMNGDYKAFVLTGHAGDGKTSILVQILKALNLLSTGEGLKIWNSYDHFYYVKDLSEIAEDEQAEVLSKALTMPKCGRTSLLITNTGPLLKTFHAIATARRAEANREFSDTERMTLQNLLLTQLDENKADMITIEGYSFYLINIARLDNVSFAKKILKKILNPVLWHECENCSAKDECPIHFNRENLSNQFERVSDFVENLYRYLYENDKRMTIRQMVGHISYGITGNLNCQIIKNTMLKKPKFNYNFANLFFGYIGITANQDSEQIEGIQHLRRLKLDSISLTDDYKLFVNQDYTMFNPAIEELLQDLNKTYRMHYQVINESNAIMHNKNSSLLEMRRAVRRYYLLYSNLENNALLYNQLFGEFFSDYTRLITKRMSKFQIRNMERVVFDAIYVKNTGMMPEGDHPLPLTLRREDGAFQNVMLILGEISRTSLTLKQVLIDNAFEDVSDKYRVVLECKNKLFDLSLPMINYFSDLINGAIVSNNNPALTHGIAKLDAMLLDVLDAPKADNREECEFKVLVNTVKGQKIETFGFANEHTLYVN